MNREDQVAVFNQLMNQPVNDNPLEVSLKNKQLGIRLIFSELKELATASGCLATFTQLCNCSINETFEKFGGLEEHQDDLNKAFAEMLPERGIEDTNEVNKVLQMDGLCDVQYTLSWAVNVFGHSKNFELAFEEVCRSNNSKACLTASDAELTKEHWENPETKESGGEHHIEPVKTEAGDYYVVKRTSDGKVRKSIRYSPARLEKFV